MESEFLKKIQLYLSEGFNREVQLVERRINLYQVYLPLYYPDGDMIDIFISKGNDHKIKIQDMGNTLMKLSYYIDINSKTKQKLYNSILDSYQINTDNGNLYLFADYEEVYFSIMQLATVIIKISDISFLKRELVKSLFYEYFDKYVNTELKQFNPVKEFYPEFDLQKLYPSPYAIIWNDKPPLCIFPISSDDKCTEVTIIAQYYESVNFKHSSIVVFEAQEDISRKPLARLSNVIGRQFANFEGNEKRIYRYIEETVNA